MGYHLPKRYKVIWHENGFCEIVFSSKLNTMRVVRDLFGKSGAIYFKKGKEHIVVHALPKQDFVVELNETGDKKRIIIPPVRKVPQVGWIIGWWHSIHREHLEWIRYFGIPNKKSR